MADLQTIGTAVAILCSVCGLAISLATYLTTRRDREPHIEVNVGTGIPTPGAEEDIEMCVAAVNTGIRLVRIEEAGLFLPDGKKLVFYAPEPIVANTSYWLQASITAASPPEQAPNRSDTLPCDLSAGQKCHQCLPIEMVAHAVQDQGYGTGVMLVGYARDAQGKHYQGKPFPFDPSRWLTQPEQEVAE